MKNSDTWLNGRKKVNKAYKTSEGKVAKQKCGHFKQACV